VTLRIYRTYQALIFAVLGFFLLQKIMDGTILLFINQRFSLLIFLAALGFIILSQVVLRTRPEHPQREEPSGQNATPGTDCANDIHNKKFSGSGLWWVIIPVILSILAPARSLNANPLLAQGISQRATYSNRIVDEAAILEIPFDQRSILDWIRAFDYSKDVTLLVGLPVDLTGFVYHDERSSASNFIVGRMAVTCCVADASAVGMEVEWPKATLLTDNSWIRIRGTIQVRSVGDKQVPFVQAESIDPIGMPEQPYLYP
jgi:putative membrane protein